MVVIFAVFAMAASALIAYLTIVAARRLDLGADETVGVHKFHNHWVPRLGGIAIFVALTSSLLAVTWLLGTEVQHVVAFIVCILPVFCVGLVEDVTAKCDISSRLILPMLSAALCWWLLDGRLLRVDIPTVDAWLHASPFFALMLTMIAVGGITQAVNIIDGYNGLSPFFALVALAAIGIVGHLVGDVLVERIALLAAASVAGFLLWNFPHGHIFMGDAGAYLVGFCIGELSVLLVTRNPEVSAWFPMLLVIYPVWETLFAIYRKAILKNTSPSQPDGLHLHMLIHKRLVKSPYGGTARQRMLKRNSSTSPYLWVLSLMTAIPALIFWDQGAWLQGFCVVAVLACFTLYWRIVRFRAPKFMVFRPTIEGVRQTSATTDV